MFTAETLRERWNQMKEFEREHCGLKFGTDFPAVADILRSSKEFLNLGGVMTLLSGLEMSSLAERMRKTAEPGRGAIAQELLEKPSAFHVTMAEIFYLGYCLGRESGEISALENLANKSTVVG